MNEITTSEMGLPNIQEMEMLMKYCEIMSKAPAYAAMGGMPGVFALVMTARELGIGPMTALNGGMYLIPPGIDKEGKPKGSPTIMMAAKTMSMMIWKAGHKIQVVEANDYQVILKGTRRDNDIEMEVTMNLDKAKQAQLSHDMFGKPKLWSTWFKNPEDMLWKTCVAKLGRRLFTDVIGNAYEPSEFSEKDEKDDAKKIDKKKLTGKNIISSTEQVLAIENSSIEAETNEVPQSLSFEEFVEKYKLNPKKDDRDQKMIDYILLAAQKRSKTFIEMANYCKDNLKSFLEAYKAHCEKNQTNSIIEE